MIVLKFNVMFICCILMSKYFLSHSLQFVSEWQTGRIYAKSGFIFWNEVWWRWCRWNCTPLISNYYLLIILYNVKHECLHSLLKQCSFIKSEWRFCIVLYNLMPHKLIKLKMNQSCSSQVHWKAIVLARLSLWDERHSFLCPEWWLRLERL